MCGGWINNKWQLVEYEKLIYLDGDIQVFKNIDHLFDLPNGYFYAVMDCFCEASWSKTPQYKIGYCQQCPEKVQWPTAELGPLPSLYFNAGFFVYEPSIPTYHDILKKLQETPPTSFAEQVLPLFFKFFTYIFLVQMSHKAGMRIHPKITWNSNQLSYPFTYSLIMCMESKLTFNYQYI